MAQINFAKGEVQCKIVYYGPAESGKTANLRLIHDRSPERIRGKLTTIATDANRTLFFDFLPLNLGKVANIRTKLNLYAVPYIDGHNALRILVLEGVDGIVFVADARKDRLEANREALANLRANLAELGRDPDEVPILFQANKMDLEGAVEARRLADALDIGDSPALDACADDGAGVMASLKTITGDVLDKVVSMMGRTPSTTAEPKSVPVVEMEEPKPSAPEEPEPVFTPAWHRKAPDDNGTDTSTSTGLPPPQTEHQPSPAIVHGNRTPAAASAHPPMPGVPVTASSEPVAPPRADPPPPAPTPDPAPHVLDLKISAEEAESAGQWDDGPITDPFMEPSNTEQPFPAAGGGMGMVSEEPVSRPKRAVPVGAGGSRGRARRKDLPEFGWGPGQVANRPQPVPKRKKNTDARPVSDRRQRSRHAWRADPPSAKQMTAGAMAALVWLAVTGFVVFELL